MTEQDMIDLLTVYDAVEDLTSALGAIIGDDVPTSSFGGGIMGRLEYIEEVIRRNSPLYDPNKDLMTQEYGQILEDRSMGYPERARKLMGGGST